MKRERFAKIVATLGFASDSKEMIEKLFLAGVDVFRLNFSHGTHEQHKDAVKNIRLLEKKYNHPVAILQDLQGPKFRIGRFLEDKIILKKGQKFIFDLDDTKGNSGRVYLPHPEIFNAVKSGDKLLIDDARVSFEVLSNSGVSIEANHIYGKALSNNKGVNLPDTVLDVTALTEKDHKDLQFGMSLDIDYVALSFVQKAEDMRYLRSLVGNKISILAKIEKPSAVNDIDNILTESDAVMLARGDLGVEYPPEQLPRLQKQVVGSARNMGKPIIIATQMLESMIESPVPTRAEATDVDNAISEGVDAVMLSAETAAGKYPEESVKFMNRMITEAEKDPKYIKDIRLSQEQMVETTEGMVSHAVKAIVNHTKITSIVCYTTSGQSAARMGRERALTPIIALTPSVENARKLQLYWGINANVLTEVNRLQDVVFHASKITQARGYVEKGDRVIITAGVPFGKSGTTNSIRLATIGEDDDKSIIA